MKTQNYGTEEKSYASVTSVSVTDAYFVENSKVITKAKPFHENRAISSGATTVALNVTQKVLKS